MKTALALGWLLAVGTAAVSGCTIPVEKLPARCAAIAIDPSRELVVTEPALVGDPAFGFERIAGFAAGNLALGAPATGLELVAIVNRLDRVDVGEPELRFVYGATADGERLAETVIVELALSSATPPRGWAERWHSLGSLSGSALRDALVALVEDALAGERHGRIRIEDAREGLAVFHERTWSGGGAVPHGLANTPRADAPVAPFVRDHESAVLRGSYQLPDDVLASSVVAEPPTFALDGVSDATKAAFAHGTCNGCHLDRSIDGSFHVSPLRRGDAALSPFVRDVELPRRADALRGLLCR